MNAFAWFAEKNAMSTTSTAPNQSPGNGRAVLEQIFFLTVFEV